MRSSDRDHNQISLSGLLNHRNRIAVGLLFILLLTACGGSGSAGEVSDESATAGDSDPIVVDVEMTDNKFALSTTTFSVGQQVEFVVNNAGAAIHDMRIEGTEFKSEPVIDPGTTNSFTAMFTKAGVYTYVCDYHLPGMVGEITVEG